MNTPRDTALLVLDAQNDLLGAQGASSKRHVPVEQAARALAWAVSAARQQGRRVVWVTSVYGELDPTEARRGETHVGASCCVRGTWGAAVIDALRPLFDARGEEPHVEKRWYSAFRGTALHEGLKGLGVRRLILCGVATDVCVRATAQEARALGYAVDVLADATTAGSHGRHLSALRACEGFGARVLSWGEYLAEGGVEVRLEGLGAGDTVLRCGALRDCIEAGVDTFDALEREVAWSAMFHRGGEVPRRVAIQGGRGEGGAEPLYRHPVDGQPEMRGWTPVVDRIRRAVEVRVGHPLNHCLLQLYRDGRDWISEHSDKTLDLVRPSSIINVSLGRTRTMVLRPKRSDEAAQKVPLPHGSMLVMGLGTNRAVYHAIKQEGAGDDDGPRISLTFRHIGTWYEPATGAVWGVGAPAKSREEAVERARRRAAEDPAERSRADRDDATRMLALFRDENIDPDFDVARYRPGFDAIDLRVLNEEAR